MYQSIYETNAGYPNWNIIIFGNITIRKETATDISTIQNKKKMRTTLIQTTPGSKTKCCGRVSYPV